MAKTKELTGVLICPDLGTAERKTIENSLDSYYSALDCELIDIVERSLEGKYFDFVCDDMGLLKSDPMMSGVDENGHPMLVGRLFVCHHDDEGNLTSLTDEEIEDVLDHCLTVFSPAHGMYRALVGLWY